MKRVRLFEIPKRIYASILMLIFTALSFNVDAQQFTVTTQPALTPNNGQSGITFNVKANVAIKIVEIKNVFNVGTISYTVWYSTDSINGAPNIATTNNWVQHESGTVTSTSNTLETTVVLNNAISIPAGETYGFMLEAGTRYHSNAATSPTAFTDGNIVLNTGANVGYGGAPPNPTFTIRQFCGSIVYEFDVQGFNDAAVLSVDSPLVFCSGTNNVVATIANFGLNQIDTVDVNWEVNGIAQPTFQYTSLLDTIGGLNPNSAQITLGSVSFNAGANDIRVYTSNPNGGNDTTNINDTIDVVVNSAAAPLSIQILNPTLNSAQVNAVGGAGTVEYEYGLAGFTLGTGTSGSSLTSLFTLTGLQQGSTYDVYVRSNCGGTDVSAWVGPETFNTSYGVPFFQDFENFTAGITGNPWPEGWSSTTTVDPNWESEDASGANENSAATGPLFDHTQFGTAGGMYIYMETSGGTVGDSADFVSPPIFIDSSLQAVELSYWYFNHGADIDEMLVIVDTNGVENVIASFVGQQQANQADSWLQSTHFLTGYAGKSITIKFRGINPPCCSGDIAIDDIRIDPVVQLNAKVNEVVSPSGSLCPGPLSASVQIENAGIDTITTVDVVMDVNGVLDTVTFNGALGTGDLATVSFPNITISSGILYDIDFYSINPNNSIDLFQADDTLRIQGLSTGISGTATIDASLPASATNFQSFSALASQLNTVGICGNVTVTVAPGTYNDVFFLDNIPGTDSSNQITIDGIDSSLVTLTNNLANDRALISFNGVSYVNIKNMTLLSTSTSTADHFGVHFSGASSYDSLVNLRVLVNPNATLGAIGIGASSDITNDFAEGDNASFVTVMNCKVEGGDYNIHFEGPSTGEWNSGNSFINNTLENADDYGFYFDQQDSLTVRGNSVTGLRTTSTFSGYGIANFDGMNFSIRENLLNANYYGIYCTNANSSRFADFPAEIINNMVTSATNYGIYLTTPVNMNIYHNSVRVEGATEAFYFTSSFADSLDVRNNIFSSNSDPAMRTSGADSTVFLRLDNNVYHTTSSADLLNINGILYANLAAYQAAQSNFDIRSLEGDPQFLSNTDLHIVGSFVNNNGDNFVGVTTDIDGDPRPFPFSTDVDPGADEFDPPLCPPPLDIRTFNPGLDSVTIVVDGVSQEYQWKITLGGAPQASGDSGIIFSDSVRLGGLNSSTTYDLYVREICGRGDTSVWIGPITFNTANGIPYFEDFESFPPGITGDPWPKGWSSSTTVDPNWESEDATGANENSTNTGPFYDHTQFGTSGGTYIYMETSGGTVGATADFVSPPVFVASNLNAVKLGYWYFFHGVNIDKMDVVVLSNGIEDTIATIVGQQQANQATDPWIQDEQFITGYAGQSIQIIFRGYNVACCTGDIAIDDVSLDPVVPLNAGVIEVLSPSEAVCPGSLTSEVVIENKGSDTLTTVDVVLDLNGVLDTVTVNQTLATGDTAHVQLPPSVLIASTTYDFKFYTISPNGQPDMFNNDDTLSANNFQPGLNNIALNMTADFQNATLNSVEVIVSGVVGAVDYEYGPAGFTLGTGTSGSSASANFTISGLTQGTAYDLYIRSDCGGSDFSAWSGPERFNTSYGVPYIEDFETFAAGINGNPWPRGWSSNTTTNPNWESEDATGANENSTGTGPFYDHTTPATSGGMYVFLETSGGALGDFSEFTSPPIFVDSALQTVEMSFWYHMHGADMGDLVVFADTNGVRDTLFFISGEQQANQPDPWLKDSILMTGYAGKSVQLVFKGIRGNGFTSDMSIDDIAIDPLLDDDAQLTALLEPTINADSCYGANEDVIIQIGNVGVQAMDFTVDTTIVEVNVGGAITQSLSVTLDDNSLNGGLPLVTGNFIEVNMGSINMSSPGNYEFEAIVNLPSDGFSSNDTLYRTLTLNATTGGIISGLDSICIGDSSILKAESYQGELQWQEWDGTAWVDITGATGNSYTAIPSVITDYRVLACGTAPSDTITVTPISLNGPSVLKNDSIVVICGNLGIDSLIMVSQLDIEMKWYDAPIEGNLQHTGDTLIYTATPDSANPTSADTFYVAATTGGGGAGGNIAPLATISGDGTGGGGCRPVGATTPAGCAALNDLDFGTCGTQLLWISTATPPSTTPGDDYIEWTFPTPKTFDTLVIHHANTTARFLTGALVQYWDGSAWVNHSSFSNLPQQCVNRIPIGRLTTDRFRITQWQAGTGQQSNMNFREIEIIEVAGCESPRTMVVGRVDCLVGLDDNELAESTSLTVYPNPSSGLFTLNINTEKQEQFVLTVRDVKGQLVYTGDVSVNGEYRNDLDFTGFAKGIYYLQIQTETATKVEKLIIQ